MTRSGQTCGMIVLTIMCTIDLATSKLRDHVRSDEVTPKNLELHTVTVPEPVEKQVQLLDM